MTFRDFIINEQQIAQDDDKRYFGQKVGDILTAIHNVEEDGRGMGARKMTKVTLTIVNQIRNVLHDQWSDVIQPFLPVLQKCGVALMKSIDEKGDVNETLSSAAGELEGLLNTLGVPINQVGSGLDDNSPEG